MEKGVAIRRAITALFVLAVFISLAFLLAGAAFASEYSDCIDACGGTDVWSTSQIEHCPSLPGAGSGDTGGDGTIGDGEGGEGTIDGNIGLVNRLSFESIEDLLDKIADILFTYSIPLLVIMIIIGAFYLLTAGGSPDKISTGKKIITWAIIGFVVILIAGSIASLIRNLLTE